MRVETASGIVEGEAVAAPDGTPLVRFLGVPYAGSTGGDRRFRAPVAPEPWTGVRAAREHGPSAPQAGPIPTALPWFTPAATSEDCLSLNVWTPSPDGSLPVMVWIHGGAYTSGGAAEEVYDAARFAAEGDVVVVTINYRLGALGFLTTAGDGGGDGDPCCGLLDQLAALAWVREHASAFGGDPGNVTVFGESAGVGSIQHLAASPLARGAFDRAIVQSGQPTTLSAEQAEVVATTFAGHLGLDRVDLERMRALPVEEIVRAQVATVIDLVVTVGVMPFAPAINGQVVDVDVLDGFRAGRAAGVPFVIGTTRDELPLFPDPRSASLDREQLTRRLARTLSTDNAGAERAIAAYAGVLGRDASDGDIWEAVRTDSMMRIPNIGVADAQAQHEPATFLYRFDWAAPGLGAVHAVDIPFTFGTFDREGWGSAVGYDARAEQLGTAVRAAWSAFAYADDPWERHDPRTRSTMVFDATSRVEPDPAGATRALYESGASR